MGEGKVENRQYAFKIARVSVLKTTTKGAQEVAQREADKTKKTLEEALQKTYDQADKLFQDKDKMELWKKLKKGRMKLIPEHENLLRLAEMRLRKLLIPGRNGWVLLPEDPEEGEQQELGSESVPHAGNRVVEGVVEAIEGS